MVSRTIVSLLSIAALFLGTATAFPSRTHCLCTILDSSSTPKSHRYNAESIPPTEHPDAPPREYREAPPHNICSMLGPELENLRAEKPDLYTEFISHALTTTIAEDATSTDEERPLSTTVLLQLAARKGFASLGVVLPSAPAEKSRERIVCRTEIESSPTYQDSLITLFVLQVIVGLAVLACVAEGITLALRWYVPSGFYPRDPLEDHILTLDTRMSRSALEHVPEKPALRLSGEEKRLLAVPEQEMMFSPGVDKKQRSYRNGDWTPRLASGKKEFEAYVVEEDDDELSRPVM
ncbi:hypothetical protein K458DRAFT_2901 [Lentithecium fluviatile CBS 122367]|uniref:Uncharacterized protein n=1 Tax=Lentithecium fluviatile CBS 122367 TaxID=1168545 RepID=A0A6G1JLZ0_9PLEO|nr:hypothetical protein K458DRAFT_2901 [Lentithecium fluviatile CBS 122367]